MILKEIESMMFERLRPKLESRGINVNHVDLIADFDTINFEIEDDERETR